MSSFHQRDLDSSELGKIERSDSTKSAMTSSHGQAPRVSPSIVARIQARDVTALRELIQQTSPALLRYGASLLGSFDDAEDVVQDVFTSVWELGGDWQPMGDPMVYLLSSVRNRARNELVRRSRADLRAQRIYSTDISMDSAIPDHSYSVLHQLIDVEEATRLVQRVSAILATLPERQRTAYELRYRQRLPMAMVAEVLGISVKGAESLVIRVTRTLIRRFQEKDVDP